MRQLHGVILEVLEDRVVMFLFEAEPYDPEPGVTPTLRGDDETALAEGFEMQLAPEVLRALEPGMVVDARFRSPDRCSVLFRRRELWAREIIEQLRVVYAQGAATRDRQRKLLRGTNLLN